MVRHYNRVLKLKDERLTKLIYIWDRELNDRGIVDTWSNEVKSVFSQCNLLPTFESKCVFHLNNVINTMQSIFKLRQSEYLDQECLTKSKLRTFRTFKDFNEQPSYVTKPLTFLTAGILPELY